MKNLSPKEKNILESISDKLKNLKYKFNFTKKQQITSCKDCMRCYSDDINTKN